LQRYQRQIILPGIGEKGQALLYAAKVLVIGAGGLSCPALQYLVAAGVGNIGIADGDNVELSNLHRQILFNADDIGQNKAVAAQQKLQRQNPDCNITAYPFFLQVHNAWSIIEQYDLVLDGSDNFSTRYLVNDICVLQKKTLIYGAIYRFEGQVAVFSRIDTNGVLSAQFRDLFTEPPTGMPSCSEAGVMGVLPGIIGTMQASEAIKLITGIGKPLINKLFTFNSLNNQTFEIELEPTKAAFSAVPANRYLLENSNYSFDCHFITTSSIKEITVAEFTLLTKEKNISIIDVRELGEEPDITEFEPIQLPLSIITENHHFKLPETDIVFICQSGIRSIKAAKILAKQITSTQKIYSLKGGINSMSAPTKGSKI
jgi:molybdopterin/thiamine biosynthesis adenylyltransferase/rhodanese-related sulfurtransferase